MGVFWEKLRFEFAKIFGGGSLSPRNQKSIPSPLYFFEFQNLTFFQCLCYNRLGGKTWED